MEEFDKNFEDKELDTDPEKLDAAEDAEAGFPAEDMFGDEEETTW